MKIALAIVTNRQIRPKTVESVIALVAASGEHQIIPIVATEGYTTAEGRTYCVVQALKSECSHILFIDDDMTFPPDTLGRLLRHEKDIVGVYSFSRKLPLTPTVGFICDDGALMPHEKMPFIKRPDELFKCFSIGMGVALIRLDVFDKIAKPWFQFTTHESGMILIGEDNWLCNQARDAGIDIYCDPTIDVGHIGDYNYKE
jgi:hypothetical protein